MFSWYFLYNNNNKNNNNNNNKIQTIVNLDPSGFHARAEIVYIFSIIFIGASFHFFSSLS